MKILLPLLWIFNAVDTISTSVALKMGWTKESNPLMQWIWDQHPASFIIVKTLVLTLCVVGLWHFRERKTAQYITRAAVVLYGFVMLWHVFAWIIFLSGIEITVTFIR